MKRVWKGGELTIRIMALLFGAALMLASVGADAACRLGAAGCGVGFHGAGAGVRGVGVAPGHHHVGNAMAEGTGSGYVGR